MEFDVVTFGSAVKDVFVQTDQNLRMGRFTYKLGSKILIKELKFDIGGGGTNTAVAFSRLGFKTGCISKLGDDFSSLEILELLKKESVAFLGSKTRGASALSIILNSHEKGRTILTHKGECNNISPRDIRPFRSKWLYFSSMLERSLKTQFSLAKKMRKGGTRLAFNPSSYLIKSENIRGLLGLTEVLIINREEARDIRERFLKGGGFEQICLLGPRTVVITNRDKEVFCFHEGKKYRTIPNRNSKVVERTGAGDAFASGFVAGRMLDWPIKRCLRLGILESESVIKYFGAKNKLLRRKLK